MTTVTVDELVAASDSDTYLAKMLQIAETLGLAVTAWQEGDVTLTILELMADVMASRDEQVETPIVCGGLIDFAMQPEVTPEPVRGVIYQGGWLDMVCDQLFDTQRQAATYAKVNISFSNATGSTITYLPKTYHVQDGSGLSTYSNLGTLTIPPGSSGPFLMTCDALGGGALLPTTTNTPVPGLTLTIVAGSFQAGRDTESNSNLAGRARAKLQTLSLGGPPGAYEYFAQTIPTEDPAAVRSGLRTTPNAPVTRVLVEDAAGGPLTDPDLTVVVANSAGAYDAHDAYTDSADINIDNAVAHSSPDYVEITTHIYHGFTSGDAVYITGVGGLSGVNNDASNPQWTISNALEDGFRIPASATGSFTSGGTVYRVSDLDLVKKNEAAYAIPDGILVGLVSATNQNMTVEWFAEMRAAGATQALVDKINTAIQTYMGTLPIEGLPLSGGGKGVPFSGVAGTIWVQDPRNLVSVHVKLGGVLDTDYTLSGSRKVARISSLNPTLITDSTRITVI